MTHKLGILVLALVLCSATQAAAGSIPLFNTGAGVAEGQQDNHWTLVSGPWCPLGNCGVYAMVTDSYPAPKYGSQNNDVSKWIQPFSGNQDYAPAGSYTFRTTFSLEGLDPATASINGRLSSDNFTEVILNGISLGVITGPQAFLTWTAFALTSGFVTGLNTLDFVVYNIPCENPACVRNPVSLRVEFQNGDAVAVPEPASLALLVSGISALALRTVRRRRQA
jgi:hypothetical protein